MRRGLYTIDFEPVVQIGDYVKLLPEEQFGSNIYVVKKIVPYPIAAVVNLGKIAANSQTDLIEIDSLKLPANWFGQWRIYLVDDIVISEVRYKGRAGNMMWSLKENVGYLSIDNAGSQFSEIFTFQDDKLYIRAKNTHDIDMIGRIVFKGYGFKIELAAPEGKPFTRIPIGAMSVIG